MLDRGVHTGDRFGTDPRHVGECDHPTARVGCRSHTEREAGANAAFGFGKWHHARTRRIERDSECTIMLANDREDLTDCGTKMAAGHHADRFAGYFDEQLVAAETDCAACGE